MEISLKHNDVVRNINPHLLSLYKIRNEHSTSIMNAVELANSKRFDVMFKYIYAKHKMMRNGERWAREVYKSHLKCFGDFNEGDGAGKNSYDKYEKAFDDLLVSVEKKGFDKQRGYIPIDRHGVIIDGSHRAAACLFHSCDTNVIIFDIDANIYDYKYFLERGMPRCAADAAALEYVKRIDDVYGAVIFPVANEHIDESIEIIMKESDIIYEKDVLFNRCGRQNIIRMLYRNEKWLGDDKEVTRGLLHHSENRFQTGQPVKFLFIRCKNRDNIIKIKKSIRLLCNMGNDPIHINDTKEGSIDIAKSVLNDNSIKYLNSVPAGAVCISAKNNINIIKGNIYNNQNDDECICVDGGTIMAIYGLREANDLDYISCSKNGSVRGGSVDCNNDKACYHAECIDDLIFNPDNHFYYRNIKCLTLRNLELFKRNRKEKRDCVDLELIRQFYRGNRYYLNTHVNNIYNLKNILRTRHNLHNYIIFKIKKMLPKEVRMLLKKLIELKLLIREYCKPYYRHREYKGYKLFYTRGMSLIKQVCRGETYESELTYNIIRDLRQREKPVFVDIGANIGLMTLNVCSALSNAKTYAFEPGNIQYHMLEKTVRYNALKESVKIYQYALADRAGDMDFYSHIAKHCSGDGFVDTKRAGKTKLGQVSVNTLDNWWDENGCPDVDVLKIDTEGSELLVLKGANRLLEKCLPKIYLEINKLNIKDYPYGPSEILQYLKRKGYVVRTIAGLIVDENNIDNVLSTNEMFMSYRS